MGSGVVLLHNTQLRVQVCPLSHVHKLLADLALKCERLFLFGYVRSLAVGQMKMGTRYLPAGMNQEGKTDSR